ncbi:MAG: hypothetical protein MZV64_61455 [Ignavibacteriales bacterium]|nr:hypothetical protein [Ignavibacteriales bacterium]
MKEGETQPVANKLFVIKNILRTNVSFRNFIVADALIAMCITATAFYPVFALTKFDLPVSYAGTFTIITTASMVAGNLFFGYLADVSGHKINLIILSISSLLSSATAIIANNILSYGMVFVFLRNYFVSFRNIKIFICYGTLFSEGTSILYCHCLIQLLRRL